MLVVRELEGFVGFLLLMEEEEGSRRPHGIERRYCRRGEHLVKGVVGEEQRGEVVGTEALSGVGARDWVDWKVKR